jgi:hypothetical protein
MNPYIEIDVSHWLLPSWKMFPLLIFLSRYINNILMIIARYNKDIGWVSSSLVIHALSTITCEWLLESCIIKNWERQKMKYWVNEMLEYLHSPQNLIQWAIYFNRISFPLENFIPYPEMCTFSLLLLSWPFKYLSSLSLNSNACNSIEYNKIKC